MYEHYCEHHHSSDRLDRVQHPSAHADAIAVALAEQAREIIYTRRKAESLLSKVQNTRTLVNLPQHIRILHILTAAFEDLIFT